MKLWLLSLLFLPLMANAQYKEGIVVIQYSANFVKSSEINLDNIKGAEQLKLYLTDHPKIFVKEKIKYLPTVILYHNKKTILRVESDISLKLPQNTLDTIQYHINKIIKNKF